MDGSAPDLRTGQHSVPCCRGGWRMYFKNWVFRSPEGPEMKTVKTSHCSHLGSLNRGTKNPELTVCVFTCPLHDSTWFTISVKIFWWALQGKHDYDIFNFMFELNSRAKAPTLTRHRETMLEFYFSGWLWATWEVKLYKIKTRFLNTSTAVLFCFLFLSRFIKQWSLPYICLDSYWHGYSQDKIRPLS